MRAADAAGPPVPRTSARPRSADAVLAAGTALGFLGDLLFADPRRGHPVAAFGRAATAAERLLWRDHRGAGALYTALCAGGTVAAAAGLSRAVRRSPAASGALTAAVTWAVLGGTSLGREARAIGAALEAGDLARARELLPGLCGRDPQSLDAPQIARAVVESVAENTSDAVVGALVWGAVAGIPGLAGFRAVNTLDAMAGHKSPRLRRFGWAPARLDDVAGFPGSRLTAALAVLAGPDPRGALRVLRSDARSHPSPNAGPVEAAFAGALGVRLGGTLAYGGRVEHRPVLGAGNRPVEPRDIERAVRLSRRVNALALVVCAGGRLLFGALRGGRRSAGTAGVLGAAGVVGTARVPGTAGVQAAAAGPARSARNAVPPTGGPPAPHGTGAPVTPRPPRSGRARRTATAVSRRSVTPRGAGPASGRPGAAGEGRG